MGSVVVVALEGRLDLASLDPLKDVLARLVEEGARRLVLDLAGVGHVDSWALAAIVAVVKRLRAAGGDLKLCGLQPAVRLVLDLTQLTRLVEVHPTRDAAIAAFPPGA